MDAGVCIFWVMARHAGSSSHKTTTVPQGTATDEAALLTTGQAARLCSVTPDTILKWIKRGRLRGVRTAGGHYRIERRELEPLVVCPRPAESPSEQLPECYSHNVHCWEYLSDRGEIRDECRQCVVYRVRAARCFLMADIEADVGHALKFCQGSCEDCAYYRRVKGLATNVLVVSCDDAMIDRIESEKDESVTLRFARCAYQASTIVEGFRAELVVVDRELVAGEESRLLQCLSRDPRLPGVRIVLAVRRGTADVVGDQVGRDVVWRVIEKPFGLREITAAPAGTDLLSRRDRYGESRV